MPCNVPDCVCGSECTCFDCVCGVILGNPATLEASGLVASLPTPPSDSAVDAADGSSNSNSSGGSNSSKSCCDSGVDAADNNVLTCCQDNGANVAEATAALSALAEVLTDPFRPAVSLVGPSKRAIADDDSGEDDVSSDEGARKRARVGADRRERNNAASMRLRSRKKAEIEDLKRIADQDKAACDALTAQINEVAAGNAALKASLALAPALLQRLAALEARLP